MRESCATAGVTVFLLLGFLLFVSSQTVWITVAYCPTDFTGAGAIVAVDAMTGNYTVVGKFVWPSSAVFGCPALYDPTVAFDRTTGNLYLDFTDDFGELVIVDVPDAKVITHTKPKDEFWVGFINMALESNGLLVGLSPTGTRNGEGEYLFSTLSPDHGEVQSLEDFPYKAITDDVLYMDDGVYWVQASYDTREDSSEWCDPHNDAALCLVAIDTSTGSIINSTLSNSYTVYNFSPVPNQNGTIPSFAFGYESLCQHPYEDFVFINVNLTDATTVPVACIPKYTSIQEEEWISSFSEDNTLFAQASAFGSEVQYLTFNATSGDTIVNSDLSGLANELGAAEGLLFFWAVDFAPNSIL